MLQGVHAETIAFTTYQQTRSGLLDGSRPLIGTATEIQLRGTPARRFRMRARDMRESGKTVSCQLELHDSDRFSTPLIRAELTFAGDAGNTRLRLRGSTARNLSPAAPRQAEMSRSLANEYARALLEHLAHAVEVRAAEGQVAVQAGGAGHAVRQKRR